MKKIIVLLSILIICFSFLSACNKDFVDTVNLTEYDITMSLDTINNEIICDQTVTYYNNTETTIERLSMNLYANAFREGATCKPYDEKTIDKAYPDGINYGGIDITKVIVNDANCNYEITGTDKNILSIPINDLFPEEKVEIGLCYSVTLPNNTLRMGYNDLSYNLANFYPIMNVYDEKGFYEETYSPYGDPFYSEVSNYKINLTIPSDYVVACTGNIKNTYSGSAIDKYEIECKNVRDFAIVASNKFKQLNNVIDGITVNYFYSVDESPETSLQAACDSLKAFNEMFGKYPYSVYNVVEVDFMEGGMEYPQLSYVTVDSSGSIREEIIAHETAHQWWYSAVGNNEIKYAWLDEGLTEFSTALYYNYMKRDNELKTKLSSAYNSLYLYSNINKEISKTVNMSMNRTLKEFTSSDDYYFTSYVQSMLMFSSIYEIIGHEEFIEAMKYYYSQNLYKIASPDDLIACINTTNKNDMESMVYSWIEGKVYIIPMI